MQRVAIVIAIIVVVALIGGGWYVTKPRNGQDVTASLIPPNDGTRDISGFARVIDPAGLTFPDAFGAHPDYQTEWWYYTGNIETADGRPFGYQFTIFRRSLTPTATERTSPFGTQDVYMAHFTVTDGAAGGFYDNERFQRGGGLVAGASAAPYHVWLDDWHVEEIAPDTYQMQAVADEVAIDFTLRSLKPPALHGINGLSQKSEQVGNASYYYSQTRLETSGTVTVKGEDFTVSGLSWKDHEYGTSALAPNAVGWDWFSLQLSDGRELMYFQIRTEGGGVEPASSGSLILEDGSVRALTATEVRVEVLQTWTSQETGGIYPAHWHLQIPDEGIELTITPIIPNQELNVSAVYWEGAVRGEGSVNGQPIQAQGYIELTGYAGERAPSV